MIGSVAFSPASPGFLAGRCSGDPQVTGALPTKRGPQPAGGRPVVVRQADAKNRRRSSYGAIVTDRLAYRDRTCSLHICRLHNEDEWRTCSAAWRWRSAMVWRPGLARPRWWRCTVTRARAWCSSVARWAARIQRRYDWSMVSSETDSSSDSRLVTPGPSHWRLPRPAQRRRELCGWLGLPPSVLWVMR